MTCKIELEEVLWARVKKYADQVGYSCPEEFVQHAVERQMDSAASPDGGRESARKTQGLGYVDFGRDI
ncbi:MAG: hypothetical protein ABI759_28925 [Candidatus Solibacter sp.]